MMIKNNLKLKTIYNEGLTFRFLESGDIFDITYNDYQINLLKSNILDGSLMNVYLRVKKNDTFIQTPLISKEVLTKVSFGNHQVVYEGCFDDIDYCIYLVISKFQWDIHVELKTKATKEVTLFYGQDVAIQNKSSVLSSEAYTVQYIDFKSEKDAHGYTLSAKQNQGVAQYLQLGSYSNNVAFTTDGFQFFGKSYKFTQMPEALQKEKLESVIKQYEFSYLVLQSENITLTKETTISFYGYYCPHIEEDGNRQMVKVDMLSFDKTNQFNEVIQYTPKPVYKVLNGLDLSDKKIQSLFTEKRHLEIENNYILSFFTKNHHHIVLKEKEKLVERPHGHLMIHKDILHVSDHVMATTNFMFGVFNSHVVLGNTSFNKFLGDSRNPLNVQKISGQRIYLKKDGHYQILSVPSYYEMGATTTRWYYDLGDDAIIVDVYVDIDKEVQYLDAYSLNHKTYDFLVTQQVLLDVNEYMGDIEYSKLGDIITFNMSKNAFAYQKYSNLKYQMKIGPQAKIINEKDFLGFDEQHGLLILSYENTHKFSIQTQATFNEFEDLDLSLTYEQADQKGTTYFKNILKGFDLKHDRDQENMDKLSDLLFWYTHNALVHYASPHGLEQYNGAAWGTRDVCQGPVELFTAAHRYDLIREIILKVYQRQFIENGDFPQWFMFGKFYQIQAHESHGDIIVWPLRTLGYYLQSTQDTSILNETIPFMSMQENEFTANYKILDHLRKQIDNIVESFIPGTYLPRYGGGDWDDTLQPANHDLTTKMVSGWTVALLYEAFKVLGTELKETQQTLSNELLDLSSKIKSDYMKYMIVDGIPAGFVVFENKDQRSYLLHPRDNKTGLTYRLLPFVRSMISEISESDVIEAYLALIDRVFMHPDGVRLMDTAVKYQGGKKTYFVRAETAANFGREIGLQYVHAHIRYIEAMTRIGYANRAYDAIFKINPINMKAHVKNADFRQSNMYFSSSDADFNDRYEAKRSFDKIRLGQIKVKGGWRLYSSGPGIFIHQIIHHVLGIGLYHGNLHIDPVLPDELDGLEFTYYFENKKIHITYHKGESKLYVNGVASGQVSHLNKYRPSGFIIDKKDILNNEKDIQIEVWTK